MPRPISSRMTRLRGVALLRMLAASVISTMNVLWPAAQLVAGADAREDAIGQADLGLAAGTKLPIWASSVSSATWRMKVLLPAMFGPVMSQSWPDALVAVPVASRVQHDIVGHEGPRRQRLIQHRMPAIADDTGSAHRRSPAGRNRACTASSARAASTSSWASVSPVCSSRAVWAAT